MSESKTFQLSAPSRAVRDLVALTIRCFHAKKHISSAAILRQLLPVQQLVPGPGVGGAPLDGGRLDFCIVLERLIKELNRSMMQKELSERMLRNTNLEKHDLQDQLLETIGGFSEVMGDLEGQLTDPSLPPAAQPAASPDRLQEQVKESFSTNQFLQAELQRATDELAQLRSEREARRRDDRPAGGGVLVQEATRLREERSALQTRLMELSNGTFNAEKQEKVDQAHTQELKRLRQDVEQLHNSKEQLRRELQDKGREREELQQNFLYVKSQLDKVQMKQAQSFNGNGSADGSREQQKHQKALDAVGEERSRLSSRLETLLNEFEKEKGYHEQSLERLMKANGKIMEEKDRSSREVQRLSQLYADSVKQLQGVGQGGETDRTMMTTGTLRPEDGGSSDEGQDEVRKLTAELATVEESLVKREQENDSLKSRIRKLAIA